MSLLISTKQSAESHTVIKPVPQRMSGDHQERKTQKNTGHTHTHAHVHTHIQVSLEREQR